MLQRPAAPEEMGGLQPVAVVKLTKVHRAQSLELAEFIAKDIAAGVYPAEFAGTAYFYHRHAVNGLM